MSSTIFQMMLQLGGEFARRLGPAVVENSILTLLEKHAENQGKPFEITAGSDFDAIAPAGIENLPGPCGIQIMMSRRMLLSLAGLAGPPLSFASMASILIATPVDVSEEEKDRLDKLGTPTTSIEVWNRDKLAGLAQQYAEYLTNLVPEVTAAAADNLVEKSIRAKPRDWLTDREKHIGALLREYRDRHLVFFLGAGVSASTKTLPKWDELLSRLFVAMIGSKLPANLNATDTEKQYLAKNLHQVHGAFPLVEARYIRAGLGEQFASVVRDALYMDAPNAVPESELMRALSQLCVPRRSGARIRAVVNYNFDDLFERVLDDDGVGRRSIYRDVDVASQDELAIYHVHGFLPLTMEQYEGLSESTLVFSEEGYHSVFTDPYTWSNITQLNFLRESTCVMVGLSMNDPNLRRLLEIANKKANSPRHYAFMERQFTNFDIAAATAEGIREDLLRVFIETHHRLQETSFSQLGVNVIWVEDHDEIPRLLQRIRSGK